MRYLLACMLAVFVLGYMINSQVSDRKIINDNNDAITRGTQEDLKELFKGVYSPEIFKEGTYSVDIQNGVWLYNRNSGELSIAQDYAKLAIAGNTILTPIVTVDTKLELISKGFDKLTIDTVANKQDKRYTQISDLVSKYPIGLKVTH